MAAMAYETDELPTVEQRAFTFLVITRFEPEVWDGWHQTLSNNDAKLQPMRDLARVPTATEVLKVEQEEE